MLVVAAFEKYCSANSPKCCPQKTQNSADKILALEYRLCGYIVTPRKVVIPNSENGRFIRYSRSLIPHFSAQTRSRN